MDNNGFRWRSECVCVQSRDALELAEMMNEAFAGRFIVGTHVFPPADKRQPIWTAFVYFKVRV